MQKLSNFTGQARHIMNPATFGMGGSRSHLDASAGPQQHPQMSAHQQRQVNRSLAPPNMPTAPQEPSIVTLSFNVPFSSSLPGPNPDDIIHASPGAQQRWTHPVNSPLPGSLPVYQLPVHLRNLEHLRSLCKSYSDASAGRVEATVTSTDPKLSAPGPRLLRKAQVTNVAITGDGDAVHKIRQKILSEVPIALKCAVVPVEEGYVFDPEQETIRMQVTEHLDKIAKYTGSDIFLLRPRPADPDNISANYANGTDQSLEQRLQICIYGDVESSEHAKMRVLLMIDQILKRQVDSMRLETSLHSVVCGRTRKTIRQIEAMTNTAIYFPPPFPRVYGYTPPGAHRRGEDEVFITGDSQEALAQAKRKIHELVSGTKCYMKEIAVSSHKIDSILLERLDKVRRIMDQNGSYVLFPPLGSQRGLVRIQGVEILHVERTAREIMALAGQFYNAQWWIVQPDVMHAAQGQPKPAEVRAMLADICVNSGADLAFEKNSFAINGSDDTVKAAMVVVANIPFVSRSNYQMRVKIELANEHKEFVSGKKNGKINKIMGQSNVQILFDAFNEYNFCIDVCGGQYEAVKNGLDLVEQEMPASISFHVPDQYHKRIIGIGGQHIQRIMKKYSVFVKFSNAMDRGSVGKDEDDIKVDNVICRTPARNAQSLDAVKQEIMDMVEKADAEFVSETVAINRLYHRELIAQMPKIEELEKKWNCKIEFPSTETASDMVSISGPEYQVPQALDEFLGMVPESHEIVLPGTQVLRDFFKSPEFAAEVVGKLRTQYEVVLTVLDGAQTLDAEAEITEERLQLAYTRNNAGGIKDAIDFLVSCLVPHGLDASTVKGAIPRPKSDSFEDSLPFFNSRLLHHAPSASALATDSPTRSTFVTGDDVSERSSIFDRLRKPGSISSISSFLDRRKNHSGSSSSLFKHASSNASRASLVSMESRESGYRNPWNDSGISMPEEESAALSLANLHLNGAAPGSSHGMHPQVTSGGWPARFDTGGFKNSPAFMSPGETTPRYGGDGSRPVSSYDRPPTSHSMSTFPAPIGTPQWGAPPQAPKKN